MTVPRNQEVAAFASSAAMAFSAGEQAADWVGSIANAVADANREIEGIASRYVANQTSQLGGFYAEVFHAGSFNIAAAGARSSEWAQAVHSNAANSPDVATSWGDSYGSKYLRDAIHSLAAQARGTPEASRYFGQERLVPSDQFEATCREAAKIAYDPNRTPEQQQRFQETLNHLTDRIRSPHGIESQPLSKAEADQWAADVKQGKVAEFQLNESIPLHDAMREMGTAAVSAAVISTAMTAAPATISAIIRLSKDPAYKIGDAVGDANVWIKEKGGFVATDAATKATIAAGLTVCAKGGFFGEAAQGLSSAAWGAVAVASMECAKSSYRALKGEISSEQAAYESCRTGLKITASFAGRCAGQALIPIPVVGGIIGAYVAVWATECGLDSLENPRALFLLRAMDGHFAAHQEELIGLYGMTVASVELSNRYREMASQYDRMLDHGQVMIEDRRNSLETKRKTLELLQLS